MLGSVKIILEKRQNPCNFTELFINAGLYNRNTQSTAWNRLAHKELIMQVM